MDEPVRSAIENVKSGRNTSGRKAPAKAPGAPTSAPPAESKSASKRKSALNGASAAQPATPSKAPEPKTGEKTPAPKVRKGPQPLMFRTGRNPQTFADAIAERRATLKSAKETYKATRTAYAGTGKAEKKAFDEHKAAYKLLGAAIADTPLHDDGNKAEIAAAQETIKHTKATLGEARKINSAALKALDKAEKAVKQAEADLKTILAAKDTAQAAAKGA
jgi:hypothetical protein